MLAVGARQRATAGVPQVQTITLDRPAGPLDQWSAAVFSAGRGRPRSTITLPPPGRCGRPANAGPLQRRREVPLRLSTTLPPPPEFRRRRLPVPTARPARPSAHSPQPTGVTDKRARAPRFPRRRPMSWCARAFSLVQQAAVQRRRSVFLARRHTSVPRAPPVIPSDGVASSRDDGATRQRPSPTRRVDKLGPSHSRQQPGAFWRPPADTDVGRGDLGRSPMEAVPAFRLQTRAIRPKHRRVRAVVRIRSVRQRPARPGGPSPRRSSSPAPRRQAWSWRRGVPKVLPRPGRSARNDALRGRLSVQLVTARGSAGSVACLVPKAMKWRSKRKVVCAAEPRWCGHARVRSFWGSGIDTDVCALPAGDGLGRRSTRSARATEGLVRGKRLVPGLASSDTVPRRNSFGVAGSPVEEW